MPQIAVLPHAELCPDGKTFEGKTGVSLLDNALNSASGGINTFMTPRGAFDNPDTKETDESFAGLKQRVEAYRQVNGLGPDVKIPPDAVTASGSGLDPHISPANAALQIPRVARERGISEDEIRRLVNEYTDRPDFGMLGEPGVNVLRLNLALDGRRT